MTSLSDEARNSQDAARGADGDARPPIAPRDVLNLLNEFKGWIGLAVSVAAAIGWAYALFAKQAALDALECRTLADTRLVQDTGTMQILERRVRDNSREMRNLRHELRDLQKAVNKDGKTVHVGTETDQSDIQDEVSGLDREKNDLEKTLNDLKAETAFLSNSLAHRSCESEEGRKAIIAASNSAAPIGPQPPTIIMEAPSQ